MAECRPRSALISKLRCELHTRLVPFRDKLLIWEAMCEEMVSSCTLIMSNFDFSHGDLVLNA